MASLVQHCYLIGEGICPICELPLDMRDDHGWCERCGLGWRVAASDGTLHITVVFEGEPPTIAYGVLSGLGVPDDINAILTVRANEHVVLSYEL
jgi:hypothetical protein